MLIAGYFVLDRFDLGAGVPAVLFVAKNDHDDKAVVRQASGRCGATTRCVLAGGALFAAFAPALHQSSIHHNHQSSSIIIHHPHNHHLSSLYQDPGFKIHLTGQDYDRHLGDGTDTCTCLCSIIDLTLSLLY